MVRDPSFLLLAARPGAGVAGSELLQRCEWPRGVVLGLSRERGHGAVLAAARGAASSVGESQQQLQAVQRNASCLSGAARPREDPCDGAEWWDRGAQCPSCRNELLVAISIGTEIWCARSALVLPGHTRGAR